MKKHFSRISGLWRRSLAVMLAAILALSTMSVASAATKKSDESKNDNSAVQEMLKKGGKAYPKGAFGLLNTQINMTEGDADKKITVVRMGDTKGEATVEFHALDVSTRYGEDYALYMNDGLFGSERKLEADKDSKSLIDTYGDKLTAVNQDDLAADSSAADADKKTAEVKNVKTDGLSELQKAQVAQTGSLNKTKTWREIADENSDEYKDADKAMKNGAKNIQAMINSLGGVSEKLTFADGETTKEITVRVYDDETSDGQVQAMFALTNASSEVSDASDGFINISDDEKSEDAKYEFKSKDVKIQNPGKVELTLKKTAGTENLSAVTVLTTDGTAKEGDNYESFKETLIFAKGIKEKTFEISVKGNATGKKINFYVGAGNEKGEIDKDNGMAKVTILPDKKAKTTGANAKSKTGTYTTWNDNMRTFQFSTWDCHARYFSYHTSGSDLSDYSYDLRNAEKIEYCCWTDWGNGKQENNIRLVLDDNSEITLNKTLTPKSSPVNIYDPKENWTSTYFVYTHTFTAAERQRLLKYGKNVYFKAWVNDHPGWRAEDWGNCNLTYACVYFKKVTVKTDNMVQQNMYRPTIYNADGTKSQASSMMSLMNIEVGNTTPNTFANTDKDRVRINKNYSGDKNEAGVAADSGTVDFDAFYSKTSEDNHTRLGTYSMLDYEFYDSLLAKDQDTITVVPHARPKLTRVTFEKVDDGVKFYNRNFGDQIVCSCLDVIKVKAYPTDKNASVDGFIAVIAGTGKEAPVKMDEGSRDSGTVQLNGDCAGQQVFILPVRGKTSLTVMAHPQGKNLDKGIVTYAADPDDFSKTVSGDYKTPLEVPDPVIDTTYTIIGTGKKEGNVQYGVEWMDGSADTNGDGKFSKAELDNYYGKGDHSNQPATFRGSAYEFRISTSGAKKIYYQCYPVNTENTSKDLTIFGNTSLKEITIFPINKQKSKSTYVNGATLSGAGGSAVSGIDPDDSENEGYFEIWSPLLDAFQRNMLVSNYNLGDGSVLNLSSIVQPNAYLNIIYDVNSVMQVTGGGLKYWDDGKYKLTLNIESKQTSRQPQKVTLHFFKPDGTEYEGTEVSYTLKNGDNGKAELEFNPYEKKLPQGTYLAVQIEDQFGVKYPMMKTGYKVYEALGVANLSSTFKFGGAFAAVKVIGLVQGKNGTHWNGELDPKKSSNVVEQNVEINDDHGSDGNKWSEMDQLLLEKKALEQKDDDASKKALERLEEQLEDNEMQVLTLTLGVGKDDIVEKDKTSGNTYKVFADQKLDADIDLQKAKNKLADAKNEEEKKAAQKALDEAKTASDNANANYNKAVEEKLKPEKTKTEFSRSVKMGLGFTFVVSFKYDVVKEKWYFDNMMMTISADGKVSLSWKFATPIGVTITLGIDVGGKFSASVIFRDKFDSMKFYLKSGDKDELKNDEDESINILALAADGEYVDTSGAFLIAPSITLSAKAEAGPLEVSASGTADFEMNFYTEKDQKNKGTVGLTAEIGVTVFGIGGSWEFTTDPINLFGGEADSLDDALGLDGDSTKMFGSSDRFTAEDTSYADKRKGWQGANPVSAKSLDENENGVIEQKLQEKIYTQSKVDIVKINNDGDCLGVFIDVDKTREGDLNKPAVFYSVYDSSKGTWSQPAVIENDSTGDQDVRVADLGSRGLFVYWNSYAEAVKDDISKTELMNKLELRGAFFDKNAKKFNTKDSMIDVLDITKDTDDVYGDINASVVSNGNTMLVYYTKNYYAVSNAQDGEVVGDVAHADASYQVFRTYNFTGDTGTDGKFVDNFDDLTDKTVAENIKKAVEDYDAYVNSYYGQVFMTTAPDVYVEETMDDTGRYWTEQPKIYAGHSVTTEKTKNSDDSASIVGETTTLKGETVKAKSVPVIVDYDSISYNDLGIFAYSVDYDNDLSTVDDRDVYFQLYSFETGIMTHPVVVTSDSVQDTDVHLSRQSYTDKEGKAHAATLLSWIADGTIVSLDISNVIKNLGEPKTAEDGTKYYLIEKTEEAGYVPPVSVACHVPEDEDTFEDEEEMTAEEKAQAAPEITSFDIYSTDGYNYYVWTDRSNKLKDGIDPESEEASDAKNRFIETQVYMVRNDLVNNELTGEVQVTSEQGANYENVSFVVNGDGTLKALARKSGSHVVTKDEFNANIEENNKLLPEDEKAEKVTDENFTPYNDVTQQKDLVALDINPVSVPKLRDTDDMLKYAKAGEGTIFDVTVLNDGIDTLDELTVTAVDKDGNGVLVEPATDEELDESEITAAKLVKSVKLKNIVGGAKEILGAQMLTDADDDSATVKLTLTDKEGKVVDEKTVTKEFAPALSLADVEVEKTNTRDVFDLSFNVKNTGS
ncbi:MAG: hypothetical protein IIU14_00165 [Ruminococcus sp.]|nr:hypothetical protein [Ruminococcus sp.]